jgi:trimethylamine--corrinoid protein Co-methyltransferase
MPTRTRRSRGSARAAKLQQRQSETSHSQAVAPGLRGGTYKPLSDQDILRIHETVLTLLGRTGLAQPPPEILQLTQLRGGFLNERGRLCFPRVVIEDMIDQNARDIMLFARAPYQHLQLSANRVHYGCSGSAVLVLDLESGAYRPAGLQDLYDFARLSDALNNIHWFSRCVIVHDLPDALTLDLNTAYACLTGTQKHIGITVSEADNIAAVIALFDIFLGAEGRFRQTPFCQLQVSPLLSPLRFDADECRKCLTAIRAGMPLNITSSAQSAATAPATLAGTLAQATAEMLAGLILVNLIAPGHPAIFTIAPSVSDLRSGLISTGSSEGALLNAAAAQMTNFYRLPGGVVAGMSDSKLPDAQSGLEKSLSAVLAGLAGANMVYQSAGLLAGPLGASFESLIIDDEILAWAQRSVRGIEVSDETLALDLIEQVVNSSPGHFMGTAQTRQVMLSEYYYPDVGDRLLPQPWQQLGGLDMRQRARLKARQLLAGHYPPVIDRDTDRRIRERFDIRLPADVMRAR